MTALQREIVMASDIQSYLSAAQQALCMAVTEVQKMRETLPVGGEAMRSGGDGRQGCGGDLDPALDTDAAA